MDNPEAGPPPLRSGDADLSAEERALGELLSEARGLRPWPEARQAQLLQSLERGPHRASPWVRRLSVTVAVVAVLGLSAWLTLHRGARAPWTPLALASAQVEVAPGSRFHRAPSAAGPDALILESGALRLRAPGPAEVEVQAPGLQVFAIRCTTRVAALTDVSEVVVEQGSVRVVGARGGVLSLGAGESVRSDDPRLVGRMPVPLPRAATPLTPPIDVACAAPGIDHLACLRGQAAGAGLAAQNALFTLALGARDSARPAEAVEAFRDYQRRFPEGVFAPEVSLEVIDLLARQGDPRGALAEAEAFLARHPGDARALQVQLLRARLDCEVHHGPAAALGALEALVASAPAGLAEEAEVDAAICEERAGHAPAASARWRAYLAAHPQGRFAAAARARLGE